MLTGISYSFANPTDGITKKAVASLSKDFSNAHNVKWEAKGKYLLATFTLNNDVMFAYYSNDGEFMAIGRNILSDKLPIYQMIELKKNYEGYWISNLFEVNMHNDTYYYVTVENAEQTLVLKSSENGGWEVYSKTSKE